MDEAILGAIENTVQEIDEHARDDKRDEKRITELKYQIEDRKARVESLRFVIRTLNTIGD